MRKDLSPTVVWGMIVVFALIVVGVGYRMFGPQKTEYQKTGSEQMMNKVKSGGTMYQPPAGAPVPGAPGYNPSGPVPGGAPGPR